MAVPAMDTNRLVSHQADRAKRVIIWSLRSAAIACLLCSQLFRKFGNFISQLMSFLCPPAVFHVVAQVFPFFIRRMEFFFYVIAVDRKSTRLNSSHVKISYAVFC